MKNLLTIIALICSPLFLLGQGLNSATEPTANQFQKPTLHDLNGFWIGSEFFADYHSKDNNSTQVVRFNLGYSLNLGEEITKKPGRIKIELIPINLNIIDGNWTIGGGASIRMYFRKKQ